MAEIIEQNRLEEARKLELQIAEETKGLEFVQTKNEQEVKKLNKKVKATENWIKAILIIGIPILIFVAIYNYTNIPDPANEGKFLKIPINEIGDFLSGTMGGLLAFCGILYVYVAFLSQKEQMMLQNYEMKQNRLEMMLTRQEMAEQRQEMAERRSSEKLTTKMKIHNQFQSEMRNLQLKFSNKVNDPDYEPDKNEERAIQLYWYLVFDEWMTCKKLPNDDLNELWDEYYCIGAKRGYKILAFRKVLDELKLNTTFLGMKEEFLTEIGVPLNE